MKGHKKLLLTMLMGATAIAAGGVAWAAIPGDGGVIQGCYDSGGNLKVVAVPSCPRGYTSLQWNQQGPPGVPGIQGVKGDDGEPGTNGTNGASGAQGPPGPADLAALQGSRCTVGGHASKLSVTVDSTTGAVSLTCTAAYDVTVSVAGGTLSAVFFSDETAGVGSVSIGPLTTASRLLPLGHTIAVKLRSGDNHTGGGTPFTYTCAGGTPQTATARDGTTSGTYYESSPECTTTLSGAFAVTAEF